MNIVKLFGIACGTIFGATLVLVSNRGVRANIASRSAWCVEHPRGYIAVVTLTALTAVLILYILTARFA